MVNMSVNLGTVAPIGFDHIHLSPWLACLRELGCTVVQVYRNQEANVSLSQMKDALSATGMPCDSLHGVFGERYDPSSPDENSRRFAVDSFKAEADLAIELGGKLVVVHCSTIRHEGVSEDQKRRRLKQLIRSAGELGEYGAKTGVTFAFENLPAYHVIGSDVAELLDILNLAGGNVGVCFDTGHANMVGDAPRMMRQVAHKLAYVHFNDNGGVNDDHDMPGLGTLDTDGIARGLADIRYNGTLMLEVFYDVDRLRRLIDEGYADRLRRILATANAQPHP
ncbi:MAG: sugar phosphate isomerase/epimerase [Planctomycetes bacterium]|nr:sugar phosphate isomerase/epimerase [Planctomycetota bacterium]